MICVKRGIGGRVSDEIQPYMRLTTSTPDSIVTAALHALQAEGAAGREWLDALPTPLYTTDSEGRITYYNRACIAFSGRTPALGADSWCVTWKLYTQDGEHLPHDQCPMAVAVREKRSVRGVEAVAERPDGSRIAFRPYPTPNLDDEGNVLFAVNMLVEADAARRSEHLAQQAERCRRFARSVSDERTAATLNGMADDYQRQAASLLALA